MAFWGTAAGRAAIRCDVTFEDPGGKYAEYHARLQACVDAAAREWGQVIAGDGRLGIIVRFDDKTEGGVRGRSIRYTEVRRLGTYKVYEQGAMTRIRNSEKSADPAPDAELVIAPKFMAERMWLDPEPEKRVADVPVDRADAVSLFTHEMGHILAFHTWQNDAEAEGNKALSAYDVFVSKEGEGAGRAVQWAFVGPRATGLFGRPVPLDAKHVSHLGVAPTGVGDLSNELMRDLSGVNGRRFVITPLTVAMLQDMGVKVRAAGPGAETQAGSTMPAAKAATGSNPTPRGDTEAAPMPWGLVLGLGAGMLVGVLAVGFGIGVFTERRRAHAFHLAQENRPA